MTKKELKDHSDKIFQTLTDRGIDTSQFKSYEEFSEYAKTLDNEFPFCYGMWDFDIPSWLSCTRLDLRSGKFFPFQTETLFYEEQYECYLNEIDDLLSDDDELSDLDNNDMGSHISFDEWLVYDYVYVYVGKPYSNIDSDDKFICSDYVKEALTEKAFYQRCFEEYLREIEDFDCLSVIKNVDDFFEIDNSRYQTCNEDYVFIGEYGEYISHDESLNENYIFIDEYGEYISRDEFVEELDRKHILKHFDEV